MSGSKSSDAFSPLPGRAAADTPPPGRTRSGRWKLFLLLLVFAAPVVLSYFMYYVVRPEGRRNFGELIDPQRPMPTEAQVTTRDGTPQRLGALRDQWLLVSVAPSGCDAVCRNNLYLQRQIRESLGREKDRLDWVWLVTDAGALSDDIVAGLQYATVLRIDADAVGGWLQPAAGQQLEDHLYVVDPRGNWMMRLPAGLDQAGAAKARGDLDRLLRASAGWDREGRPQEGAAQ